jgi:hypothetical protein
MPIDLRRPAFYSYLHEGVSLDEYVHDQIRVRLINRRTGLFDERNVQSYRHGNRWALSASEAGTSEMQSMAAESRIHTMDIINHETIIVENYIESMVEQLFDSLMKHLYQTVGDAAESVGNVVSRSDHGGDAPAGFLAMLEKIQFSVDRYGRAQRPTMHVSISEGPKFVDALRKQPIEYHLEVETISEEKEKEAVVREADRISKFRWKRL